MRSRIFFLIASTSLLAQIRVEVQQVLVPVVVTDKKGHHVTGLHASDFRILEDGEAQEIAAFSTDTTASVDDVKGPRRTYVICIDTLHSSPSDNGRVREALESFFHDEKGTDAQYVLIGIGRQLQVLQTATSNPLAVLLKIRAPGFLAAIGGPDAAALGAQLHNLNNRMEEFCRGCACGARSNQRSCDSEIDTLKQSIDSEAGQWTPRFDAMAGQFKSVVEEIAKLPTGRTVMLISGGFNMNPKHEFYAIASTWLPASPQFRIQNSKDLEPALQDALKVADARNVTIYGIDSRGSSAPALASSGSMDASGGGGGRGVQSVIRPTGASVRTTGLQTPGQSSGAADSVTMEQLANSTGGVYYHDTRDLLKQFRSVTADGREYYLLAYVPKNGAADGSFRKITVAVTGKNLSVRAKAGYWAARSDQ